MLKSYIKSYFILYKTHLIFNIITIKQKLI